MELIDIINTSNLIREKIDYIFNSFKKTFPNVYLNKGKRALYVSEPYRKYMCYFTANRAGEVKIKFQKQKQQISIFDDVDLLIKETICLFEDNDLSRGGKVENKFDDYVKSIHVELEEAQFDKIIKKVTIEKGDLLVGEILSDTTSNALYAIGIAKLAQLRGWDHTKLKSEQGFHTATLTEMYYVFHSLMQDEMPKDIIEKEILLLDSKAPTWQVENFSKKGYIVEYLKSIDFNEYKFTEGSIGNILCLKEKVNIENSSIHFCQDAEQLKEKFLENKDRLEQLLLNTKTLLFDVINHTKLSSRDKNITLLFLGIEETIPTLESVGERYGISRERVRQVFNKSLKTSAKTFNPHTKTGVYLCSQRRDYFKLFLDCPIDILMLYLKKEGQGCVFNALNEVILHGIETPNNLNERIVTADKLLKKPAETQPAKPEKKHPHKKSEFEYIIDENGVILTDLELLAKLRKARLDLSFKYNYPAYMVYNNKQLVVLATFKPTTKIEYASLHHLTENSWEKKGCIMAEIIKEHLENKQ